MRQFHHPLWLVSVVALVVTAAFEASGDDSEFPLVKQPKVMIDVRRGMCAEPFVRFLKTRGYTLLAHKGIVTAESLADVDVLLMEVGLQTTKYSDDEVAAIEAYFRRGGVIVMSGNGWAFVHYGKGPSREYPPNRFTPFTGIFVKAEYAWGAERMTDHPIGEGVKRFDYANAATSPLKLSGEAKPLAYDHHNRVVMAVTETEGKAVYLGHEWVYREAAWKTSDVERLLSNLVDWAAPPVVAATPENIPELLAKRGDVKWLQTDPVDKNILWSLLNDTIVKITVSTAVCQRIDLGIEGDAKATCATCAGGTVWVGTRSGLWTFRRQTRSWQAVPLNGDYELLEAEILAIQPAPSGEGRLTIRYRSGGKEGTSTCLPDGAEWRWQ